MAIYNTLARSAKRFQQNLANGSNGKVGAIPEVAANLTVDKPTTTNNNNENAVNDTNTSPSTEAATGTETKTETVTEAETAPEVSNSVEYDPAVDNAYQSALSALMQAQGAAPVYKNSYSSQLQDVYNQIVNREKFSFDINSDAMYQQMKDQYVAQGKLAMADTMGQAAAMNGGYGSSYAQSVGQQAYQGYMQQLNDVVPELYDRALAQYNQEGQDLLTQYAMLGDMADDEYAKYQDSLKKYYTDRDVAIQDVDNAYNRVMSFIGTDYTPSDSELAAARLTRAQYDAISKYATTSSEGSTGARILWTPTGAVDGNGNVIFENSLGERKAFGEGVNPYTGTKHRDVEYGAFSNGYQPDNIGGTKLVNSGISTDITGKKQTIWEANGKYWLWRGDKNQYIEVDLSDLD